MSDIFQEVEESVRQDRLAGFARKYGLWILSAIVVALLAVGGWRLYQGFEANAARDRADILGAAQKQLREGDVQGAEAALQIAAKSGPGNYRALAYMEMGKASQMQGDLEGAVEHFDKAAELASNKDVRDSARLRAAFLAAETQDFAAVQERLKPLIDDGGAFSYLARELLGVEAWEAGNLDLARSTLEPLRLAFEAPESVRQRAELALTVIGPPGAPAPSVMRGQQPGAPAAQQPQEAPPQQQQAPARRSAAQPAQPPQPQYELPPVRTVPTPAGEPK